MKTKNLIAIIAMILIVVSSLFSTISLADEPTYTITLNGSDVTSRTYEAYKIFNISGTTNNYSYTWTTEAKAFFATYLSGQYNTEAKAVAYLQSLASDSEALYNFAKAYSGTAVASSEVSGDKNTISNLTAGYYLIHETDDVVPTSVNMLLPVVAENVDATTGTIVLNVKAESVPTPGKIAKNQSGTPISTVAVGDTVTFEVTGKAPNTKGYKAYIYDIIDTMTGLTFKAITSVKVGEKNLTSTEYISSLNGSTLKVSLGAYLLAHPEDAGKTITVTYTAEVNSDAISTSTASNEVEINYSTDPSEETGGELGETDKTTVTLYTYNVNLLKTDVNNNPLSDTTFNLKDSNGIVLKRNLTTNENGIINITGLDQGTYILEETTAHTGYTTRNYKFTITANTSATALPGDATLTNTDSDEYLVVTKSTTAKSSTTVSGDDKIGITTITYTPFEIQLINSNGSLLPSTGGIGTTIFTIVGILVMASALVAFIVINKKNNR